MSKRVVVETRCGLTQILGTVESQPDDLIQAKDGLYNLVACKRGHYLYKPVMSPSESMQTFHDRQQ